MRFTGPDHVKKIDEGINYIRGDCGFHTEPVACYIRQILWTLVLFLFVGTVQVDLKSAYLSPRFT